VKQFYVAVDLFAEQAVFNPADGVAAPGLVVEVRSIHGSFTPMLLQDGTFFNGIFLGELHGTVKHLVFHPFYDWVYDGLDGLLFDRLFC